MRLPNEDAPAGGTPAWTVLRVEGRDALALLHRISTNTLEDLSPGTARGTLFCDFRGRLLHRAVVCVTADGAAWLIRDDAQSPPLTAFIDRHVFREDFRIADLSALLRPERRPAPSDLPPGALAERDAVPMAFHLEGGDALEIHPTSDRISPVDPLASERDRILAGRPAHGREIAEEFTPFEVGLAHEVHLDKGCFTGQEALMRLLTYRGVRRQLARLEHPGSAPATPANLMASDRKVGRLTSAVPGSSVADRWIGLAVIRRDTTERDGAIEVEGARSGAGLPHFFPPSRPLGRPLAT